MIQPTRKGLGAITLMTRRPGAKQQQNVKVGAFKMATRISNMRVEYLSHLQLFSYFHACCYLCLSNSEHLDLSFWPGANFTALPQASHHHRRLPLQAAPELLPSAMATPLAPPQSSSSHTGSPAAEETKSLQDSNNSDGHRAPEQGLV